MPHNKRPSCSFVIESLEPRRLLTATPWGAIPVMTGQDQVVANYPWLNGAGETVAVLDTGVDYNHPALGNGFGNTVIGGYNFITNTTNVMDTNGHGTGVSGTIAASTYTENGYHYQGIATGAKIVSLVVDDGSDDYTADQPRVIRALQWVINNYQTYNITAVNISHGYGNFSAKTAADATTAALLATLKADGVFVVSSAGNDGALSPPGAEYPSADPSAFSAGSVSAADIISSFSSRGPSMDILAPGENIPVIWFNPANGNPEYLSSDGTSFSSPYVAGAAVLLRQIDPNFTPDDIMSIMQQSGYTVVDNAVGNGPTTGLTYKSLNLFAAVQLAFQVAEGSYSNNNSLANAAHLTFSNDTISVSNEGLPLRHDAWYSFSLDQQSSVNFALGAGGPDAAPAMKLTDSNGQSIATLADGTSIVLSAGTYYIDVVSTTLSLNGTYNFTAVYTPDDGLNNHTPGTATPLSFNGGIASVSGLSLAAGDDDYFAFTLDSGAITSATINYSQSDFPSADLLDTNGNEIHSIGADGYTQYLAAGRYLIRASSANDLQALYGVTITQALLPGANAAGSSIAYARNGALYMTWYDTGANQLDFAARDANGNWSSVQSIANLLPGAMMDIAVDGNNNPGIAFYDPAASSLKYAYDNNGSWSIQTIDATGRAGLYPSLAFDTAANKPVIAYYDKATRSLKMAIVFKGKWTLATVDSSGDAGRYVNLHFDPNNNGWGLAYQNNTDGTVRYARQYRSGWVITTVDATTGGAAYLSLNFDASKHPAIAYYSLAHGNLKYAWNDGVKWHNTQVLTTAGAGLYSNLLFDSNNDADILYYNANTDSVFRAQGAPGGWAISEVESGGGSYISAAYAPDGTLTFAWLSDNLNGLDVTDL